MILHFQGVGWDVNSKISGQIISGITMSALSLFSLSPL